MTRIVLIGTSHVAALWQGWGKIEGNWPGVSVTSFAAPGRDGTSARLRGRRYGFFGKQAATTRVFGHDAPTITLDDYDHVVRVCRTFPEAAAVPLLRQFAIDGITAPDADRPGVMSSAAGTEMITALARDALPPATWHNWTEPDLTFLQIPYPDTRFAAAEVTPRHVDRQWLAQRPGEMLAVRRIYLDAHSAALAEVGIRFQTQPTDTIGRDGLSLLELSEGSLRMADGEDHDSTDLLHMNADYGAFVMTRLLETLGQDSTRPLARAAKT